MLQVPWDFNITDKFSWVQLLSHVWLFATPWTAARQASLYITSSQSLPKLMSIESDAIQPSHPLLSPSPSALNLSQHQSLFNESALRIRWPKYWSFSFSISPSNEHQDWSPLGWTGWISFQSNDSQESSPTPQFKSINSLELSFLHSPTLTSIYDH